MRGKKLSTNRDALRLTMNTMNLDVERKMSKNLKDLEKVAETDLQVRAVEVEAEVVAVGVAVQVPQRHRVAVPKCQIEEKEVHHQKDLQRQLEKADLVHDLRIGTMIVERIIARMRRMKWIKDVISPQVEANLKAKRMTMTREICQNIISSMMMTST